jgi:hypothetical protein
MAPNERAREHHNELFPGHASTAKMEPSRVNGAERASGPTGGRENFSGSGSNQIGQLRGTALQNYHLTLTLLPYPMLNFHIVEAATPSLKPCLSADHPHAHDPRRVIQLQVRRYWFCG